MAGHLVGVVLLLTFPFHFTALLPGQRASKVAPGVTVITDLELEDGMALDMFIDF